MDDKYFERVPPQALEAETSVLGAMLIDEKVIPMVKSILSEDSFYSVVHQKIYAAILDLNENNEVVDLITLGTKLKGKGELGEIGGVTYLANLASSVFTTLNVEHYVKIVKEKAILRKLISAAMEIIQIAYDGQKELGPILDRSQELLFEVLKSDNTGGLKVGKLQKGLAELKTHFFFRETPFKELNQTLGGFLGGELVVIGGRPGMGKTSLVTELLKHIAIGAQKPVAYFGAETTAEVIYSRLLCSICEVKIKDFWRGKINVNQAKKLESAHQKINDAPIHILVAGMNLSAALIGSQLKALKKEVRELGLVIIENLQQLTWPLKKFQTRKEEVDIILEALKATALDIKAPIIISSQIGRQIDERENKRPLLSDLKESGRIEEIADKVLLLYRENYYRKSVPASLEKGEIIIAKGGPPKTLFLNFHGDYLSWKE